MGGTALYTDHYELTMLEAALRSGVAHRRAVFEVFARRLPPGRRYGVVCGTERVADAITRFRFGPDEVAHLRRAGFLDETTLAHLESYRFTGTVDGYREGDLFFPDSPILTVDATFGDAVVLETVVLSILNHDSAIAAAAARMVAAAGDRPIIEMGGRRTHEEAAVAAARAAYVAGFATTSNLEAARRYGVPTAGTAAHAFTLVHDDELAAFRAQVASMGSSTTLLVDTFDIEQGVRNAVAAAGPALGAIRLDSGDVATEAVRARALLDELGAPDTHIVATGDLDEHAIAALAGAPVDGFGVGTKLVTGSGAPTAELVYKLVARADSAEPDAPLRPVAKRSRHKATVGGRKHACRICDDDGFAVEEHVDQGDVTCEKGRPLQVRIIDHGDVVHRPSLDDIRAHHRRARAELHPDQLRPEPGPPALVAPAPVDGGEEP